MQPKAKWTTSGAGCWRAAVGPFRLEVILFDGECQIADAKTYDQLWFLKVPTPCDVTDLMRLTETELATRLKRAADTMDWSGLKSGGSETVPAGKLTEWPQQVHRELVTIDPRSQSAKAWSPTRDIQQEVYGACHVRGIDTDDLEKLVNDSFAAGGVRHSHADALSGDAYWSMLLEAVDWYDERKVARPRFQVGDLVRVPANVMRPTERLLVARVARGPSGLDDSYGVAFESQPLAGYSAAYMKPYALPTITSYADLANVLDELPEGTVIEAAWGKASTRFKGDPNRRGAWFVNSAYPGVWIASSELVWRNDQVRDGVAWRIVPAAEVGK